jgi:hypothetical protein
MLSLYGTKNDIFFPPFGSTNPAQYRHLVRPLAYRNPMNLFKKTQLSDEL